MNKLNNRFYTESDFADLFVLLQSKWMPSWI